MKINILSNKIPWFGKYSGYEGLPNYFPTTIHHSIYLTKNNLGDKIRGKIFKVINNLQGRSEDIFNQKRFLSKVNKSTASHILYVENNFEVLSNLKKIDKRLVVTVHLPISRWKPKYLEQLSKMDNIILLYKEDIEAFSQYIPKNKIHIIRHGVDVDFFRPGNKAEIKKNKVLFVGHFLRNFKMFYKAFEIITRENPGKFEFHFVVPTEHRHPAILQKLMTFKHVFFHENLSDVELLEQYQDSYVMLMPLDESGANTAIVQALATGLPVITTDVGGIRSYGGGEIFPLVGNNETQEMVNLFYRYQEDSDFRDTISKNQRNFAVEKLDWIKIAQEHVNLYSSIGE